MSKAGIIRAFVSDFLSGLLGKASRRDPLGPLGEKIAAGHLRRRGYRILGRNLRVRSGEADVLALAADRRTIVLVEVKARRVGGGDREDQPPPEASVDEAKRERLRRILGDLVRANGWWNRSRRIDVVGVEIPRCGEPTVRHWPGAVEIQFKSGKRGGGGGGKGVW